MTCIMKKMGPQQMRISMPMAVLMCWCFCGQKPFCTLQLQMFQIHWSRWVISRNGCYQPFPKQPSVLQCLQHALHASAGTCAHRNWLFFLLAMKRSWKHWQLLEGAPVQHCHSLHLVRPNSTKNPAQLNENCICSWLAEGIHYRSLVQDTYNSNSRVFASCHFLDTAAIPLA